MNSNTFSGVQRTADTLVADIRPNVSRISSYAVNFSGGFLQKFSDKLIFHVSERVKMVGGSVSLESEQFTKYLNTLLKARVDIANDRPTDIPRSVLKHLLVPAVHQLALNMVGWAQDQDTKEVFYPEISGLEKEDYLTTQQMIDVSGKLSILMDYGFECNPGLSLDKEGSLSFMTWTVLTNGIEQYYYREDKNAAPSEALFRSFLSVQQLDQVIRPRFCYGSVSQFDQLAELLIDDTARKVSGR